MVEDDFIFDTKTNNKLLCDVETLLGMAYVLPLLKAIQRLSKHLFICEFFFAVKFIEADLFVMYCDTKEVFTNALFFVP
jgi:hypothetical protein